MKKATEPQKLHYDLKSVGLRAQATAAGLVQLCKELNNIGVLDDLAVARIKGAIADEIALTAPRAILRAQFRQEICHRLDSIFAGEQALGEGEGLVFQANEAETAE